MCRKTVELAPVRRKMFLKLFLKCSVCLVHLMRPCSSGEERQDSDGDPPMASRQVSDDLHASVPTRGVGGDFPNRDRAIASYIASAKACIGCFSGNV